MTDAGRLGRDSDRGTDARLDKKKRRESIVKFRSPGVERWKMTESKFISVSDLKGSLTLGGGVSDFAMTEGE